MAFEFPTLSHIFANPMVILLTVYMGVLVIIACVLVVVTLRLHHKNQKTARRWAEMESRWQPLIMQALNGEAWPEQIQSHVRPDENFYFIDYLTRYAEKLSGDSRKRAAELATPYLPKLLSRTKKGDAEQRARAILTLSILAPEGHQERMVDALNDESPLVATMAARALADHGSIEYLEPILDKMERFRSWSQNYLVSMLVSLGKAQPEKLREALVLSHQPNWVKTVILKALTEINDWNTLPLAVQFLQEDAHREVQAASLQFLSRIGHDGLLDLIRKKCRHADFVIRLNAVKALANLGTAEDRELMLQLVYDPSQWIAYQAAQALKSAQDFEDLLQLALSDHPRAELAKEVLFDFESIAVVKFLAQTEHFEMHVPQWLRMVKRKDTRELWVQVQNIFLNKKTSLATQAAIAQHFDLQSPSWLYTAFEKAFLSERHQPNIHLIHALHRIQPLDAIERFKENFFGIEDAMAQYTVFQYLKRKAQPQYLNFYKAIQQALNQAPEKLALTPEQREEIKGEVERLIHKSLLGDNATQRFSSSL